jgi:hypothetical protein
MGEAMMFAWQGWRLAMPDEWNPVKLHGNYDAGYALLADIHQPRVGLRWSTPGRRFDSKAWARRVMLDEVGRLASDEAEEVECDGYRDALRYSEPKPPGRDVWVGMSRVSGRTIELVHHVHEGEESRMDDLVRDLRDGEMGWAVFDLSCRIADEWRLESHRLNAGDLSLEFARKGERMSVRQVAVAHLALKRMPIERWLEEQIRPRMKRFRRVGECEPMKIETMEGLSCRLERRMLARWNMGLPASICQAALHDVKRDRLVFIEAKDGAAVGELARSIGWANQEVMC